MIESSPSLSHVRSSWPRSPLEIALASALEDEFRDLQHCSSKVYAHAHPHAHAHAHAHALHMHMHMCMFGRTRQLTVLSLPPTRPPRPVAGFCSHACSINVYLQAVPDEIFSIRDVLSGCMIMRQRMADRAYRFVSLAEDGQTSWRAAACCAGGRVASSDLAAISPLPSPEASGPSEADLEEYVGVWRAAGVEGRDELLQAMR